MTRSSTQLRRLSSMLRCLPEIIHCDFVDTSIGGTVIAVGDIRIVGMLIAQHSAYVA